MSPAIGLVVFARLDSRRLPGKALRPLGGRPLLARVLARLERVATPTRLIVATSARSLDDPIAALADQLGVACHRGPAEDVAGRALACAEAFGLDHLVRISGDSPLIAPDLVDQVLSRHLATGADLTANLHPRTHPPGLSVEVIARPALTRAVAAMDQREDREHVTPFLYRHPESFRRAHAFPDLPPWPGGPGLTVDTPADLARAEALLATLGPDPEAVSLADLLTAHATLKLPETAPHEP